LVSLIKAGAFNAHLNIGMSLGLNHLPLPATKDKVSAINFPPSSHILVVKQAVIFQHCLGIELVFRTFAI
jgi:hypothetical protein